MSDSKLKSIEDYKNEVLQLKAEIQIKDQEIHLYKKELLKFSHQLDSVMIQISSDFDILKKIQKVLAPTEIPTIQGFEFSKKFVFGTKYGGDYFDIFEHEDKMKFGVLLSSSSGYAMSALFLSLVLKVSHMMEAKKGLPPDRVLFQLANELKSLANEKDATDVFYAVIDRRDLSLTFCAAGRICGFLQTPGEPLKILSSKVGGLSALFNDDLHSLQIDLQPKSRLTLVSKGVLEVLDPDGLCEMLSGLDPQSTVHDIRNEVLFQSHKKTGLEHPLKDQTVVVVEVKDRVIKLAK